MKRAFISLAALALALACTSERNDVNALEVSVHSVTFTGHVNLPFELEDAEVGILYDKIKSFETANKLVATELDGNEVWCSQVVHDKGIKMPERCG